MIRDKIALVTGGAMGIGRATCELFAQKGAKVAVTDMAEAEGREVADAINRDGGNARFWRLNVTDEEEIERVFREVYDHFGRLDVLVNNAGIGGTNKPTHEITSEEWDLVMNVNVKGVFFCIKHAIPYMQRGGGGSIVNLSSIYGIIGAADAPPYHASKGAVRLMTKNDALLYAKDNIRVNSVHPGFIWTPMVEKFASSQPGGVAAVRQALTNLHPIGRLGDPMDIAYAILYLGGDESRFVTGAELVVDGGYTAR
ncbi:MAG: glucose 1-dehydrogenase [Candidatus Zixiibacteriota bacterium]|nr:MAG: glucose 1-dehydrogenase [candidate division Zixibacteria bacterium]